MTDSSSNKENRSSKQIILITGASTGIGLALVNQLLERDCILFATARTGSLQQFQELGLSENDRFFIRPLDVTDEAQRLEVITEINQRFGGVDVLINNAGIYYQAVTEQTQPFEDKNQFETNYFGPMRLTRLVLPKMREKGTGCIINFSSVGGTLMMPTMSSFSASKFALEGAAEALWYELKPWGIRVCVIEPGFVHSWSFKQTLHTQISEQARQQPSDPYYNYYKYVSEMISRMNDLSPATPNRIARKIVKILDNPNPPLRIPVTMDAWFFYYLRRILPRRIYHKFLLSQLKNVKKWVPPIE